MSWKRSGEKWKDNELLPVERFAQSENGFVSVFVCGWSKNQSSLISSLVKEINTVDLIRALVKL